MIALCIINLSFQIVFNRGYSHLVWTGVCHSSLETLPILRLIMEDKGSHFKGALDNVFNFSVWLDSIYQV